MKKTGSEIICESIIAEGVPTVFGYPGGAILPLYDTLPKYEKKLHHVLTRHEQGAAFMAQGWARETGDVGVCIATSGPGATNLVTGIADAMMDSIPMVAITGQVFAKLIGTDAFQESDVTGITLPITKHNYLVTDVADLPRVMKEAFHIARTGRPGPVHVDVAKNAQIEKTEFNYKKIQVKLPGYQLPEPAKQNDLIQAAEVIAAAERPIIISGHGVIAAGATKELLAFADKTDAALVTTLHGNSGVQTGTKNYLGMLGMHGTAPANFATAEADCIIGLGIRFDDRITGTVETFAKGKTVVHVELDPAELGKIIPADAPVCGDVRDALARLTKLVTKRKLPAWHAHIRADEVASTAEIMASKKKITKHSKLQAYEAVAAIATAAPDATVVADAGQHHRWIAQHFPWTRPNQVMNSGGLGTMGFSLPTAIGAKMANPQRSVWAVMGDGCAQMNIQELGTILQEQVPVKIAIMNNSYLGMVRQWQGLFFKGNYSSVDMVNPDFVKLAEAYDVKAYRITRPEDAVKITKQAEKHKGPALVEYVIEKEADVFPMVPPGAALAETRIQ